MAANHAPVVHALSRCIVTRSLFVTCRSLHEASPKVPKLIEDFIEEMKEALLLITKRHDLPLAEKATFLRHARHTFGRTALVLSGGGALGCFHLVCSHGSQDHLNGELYICSN
jgi:TAG lipase/steryl ester hydrolase/phospholipase A2/LPA acyltransferase